MEVIIVFFWRKVNDNPWSYSDNDGTSVVSRRPKGYMVVLDKRILWWVFDVTSLFSPCNARNMSERIMGLS
jgi:hypothetical protein